MVQKRRQNAALRRVAMITGTRADYGLLTPVMDAIDKHPRLKLQVIVTGMHLLRRFGQTEREVQADARPIVGRVKLQGASENIFAESRRMGQAIAEFSNIFQRHKTDFVVVLGDRMEMFAAAAAATASQRILAHIHSGDAAMGIQDDAYRHAISKLAHIHFAASAGARRRLLKMGEDSFRIYQTGSPGLDNLSKKICKNITELNGLVGFNVREEFLIVLQHPAGATATQEERLMAQTLEGCVCKGLKIIVLYPNCDPGFSGIIRAAQRVCQRQKWTLLKHVPRDKFLGLLTRSRALVGNSSSGIIEAGFLNVDVINVGPRQMGRERGSNVLDVDYGRNNIKKAVEQILQRPRRTKRCLIYGKGQSSRQIASILARMKIDRQLKQKKITY